MTAPLLLLPLRLEYRVISADRPHRVVIDDPTDPTDPSRMEVLNQPLSTAEVALPAGTQIWFRWYFDDGFAERGVRPPEPAELAGVARFDAAVGGRAWWNADDPVVAGAWTQLAARLGPGRALHLLRDRGGSGDPDWTDRVGRIAVLPDRVGLFAVDAAGIVSALGEGSPVVEEVRYTPEALTPGGWLVDFEAAVAAGMGLRITDPDLVAAAMAARWLVAVGLHPDNPKPALRDLLSDAVANGTFGLLDQDTPTNNSSRARAPALDGRTDPLEFLRANTADEAGLLTSPLEQSCDLLAEALAVDPRPLRRAAGAADTALEDARAMVRVVGPALLDAVSGTVRGLEEATDEDVVEFLARDIVGRGVLPVVRFGDNPYGLLPVTDIAALTPLAAPGTVEHAIHRTLSRYAAAYLVSEAEHAFGVVTRLEPDEPRLSEKLEIILGQMATSRRLLVADLGEEDTAPLGCPYVIGAGFEPALYLGQLRSQPLSAMVDPTEEDARPPLLYRLARISIVKGTTLSVLEFLAGRQRLTMRELMLLPTRDDSRLEAFEAADLVRLARGQAWPIGLPDALRRKVGQRSVSVLAALAHLQQVAARPDGRARLEILLMETIDTVAHRADAWMSGLAYRHLIGRRRAGETGLRAGWYGLLEGARPGAATGTAPGYLQAPSLAQASTAALLRAAHRRFRSNGAFAIDLSSQRVRRALLLLALLQRGMSPAQAVGLRAERLLHDRDRPDLILALRDGFPVVDPESRERITVRSADGLAFLGSALETARPGDRVLLREVQALLRDELDALADLVMCEATHLRASGQPVAANAWLAVLGGDPVPGEPTFIRTRRSGHGSSHRVVVAFDPVRVASVGSDVPARTLVEPSLAAAAAAALPQTASAAVEVVVGGPDGAEPSRVRLRLGADLGMVALDLVVGGESEIAVRARQALVRRWRRHPATRALLGPLPDGPLGTVLAKTRPVTLDLGIGQMPVRTLLERAAQLRRLTGDGRPLEATDLAAAASTDRSLTDQMLLAALRPGRAELRRRAERLTAVLTASGAALRAALSTVLVRARNHQRLIAAGSDEATLAASLVDLEAARDELDAALLGAAEFAEPGALRVFGTLELSTAPEVFEAEFGRLGERLDARAAGLASALAATAALPAGGAQAQLQTSKLTEALRDAVAGDALPVLPPVTLVPATTPLLQPARGVGAVLGDWTGVRERVRLAQQVGGRIGGYRAHAFSPAATDDETGDPTADPRDEPIAPRTRLFGAVLARPATVAQAQELVGIVADEWAEVRPSRLHQTGVAINYDSPQSEPPHCLLLCEPPTETAPEWTSESAADMVTEAIKWMTIRALPAAERRLPGPLLPFANQVTAKPSERGLRRRLPIRRFRRPLDQLASFRDGAMVVLDDGEPVGLAGIGLREIAGFVPEED